VTSLAEAATAPAAAAGPVLEVRGMSRRFGGLLAVNNVSFVVAPGEIFGLIGPNGAGKTTLFNLMTGLIPPTTGTLRYRGRDITRLPPHQIAAAGIARTFQNIRLFSSLSALQNVMIAQHVHARSGVLAGVLNLPPAPQEERRIRARALELLELVGLGARAREAARNLPYGDQRRLEIARALALEPAVILLDEPAGGVNPSLLRHISDRIRALNSEGVTFIIVEHDMEFVMRLCDQVLVMHQGSALTSGPPEQVRSDPAVLEAYLGTVRKEGS